MDSNMTYRELRYLHYDGAHSETDVEDVVESVRGEGKKASKGILSKCVFGSVPPLSKHK